MNISSRSAYPAVKYPILTMKPYGVVPSMAATQLDDATPSVFGLDEAKF